MSHDKFIESCIRAPVLLDLLNLLGKTDTFSPTHLINSIIHEHSCKLFYMGRVKRIWYLSPMRAVIQEEPSDRMSDPWPLWMAGHVQSKFIMMECSKTQIHLTCHIYCLHQNSQYFCKFLTKPAVKLYSWHKVNHVLLTILSHKIARNYH